MENYKVTKTQDLTSTLNYFLDNFTNMMRPSTCFKTYLNVGPDVKVEADLYPTQEYPKVMINMYLFGDQYQI